MRRCSSTFRRGFSLIELVIVIVILGTLVTIAIPRLTHGTNNAATVTSMVAELREMTRAIEMYRAEHGAWPGDTNPGDFPSDLQGYLQPHDFSDRPPIGGTWDWNRNFYTKANLSVRSVDASNAVLIEIDAAIDDGDLSTGSLRKKSSHIYFVLEE